MMEKDIGVIYWDASAILSVIFKDKHSDLARNGAESEAIHFISSLAYAEVCAVISRMQREKRLADLLIEAGFDVLDRGPWRPITISPSWQITKALSVKWSLRGADLWHLAAAKSLQKEFPEVALITFDSKLEKAARGESL